MWRILQIEMDSDFKKKNEWVWQGGDFNPSYATNPMLIIYPHNLKGVHD